MNVSHCLSSPWPGHERLVGGWMYLTACPLRGPGHDSSVGEWMHLTICPLHGPGSIPDHDRVFRGVFPGWSRSILSQRESAWHRGGRLKSNEPFWVAPSFPYFISRSQLIPRSMMWWGYGYSAKSPYCRSTHWVSVFIECWHDSQSTIRPITSAS